MLAESAKVVLSGLLAGNRPTPREREALAVVCISVQPGRRVSSDAVSLAQNRIRRCGMAFDTVDGTLEEA